MAVSKRATKRIADRLAKLKAKRTALRAEHKARLAPLNAAIADEKAVLEAISPPTPEQPAPPAE